MKTILKEDLFVKNIIHNEYVYNPPKMAQNKLIYSKDYGVNSGCMKNFSSAIKSDNIDYQIVERYYTRIAQNTNRIQVDRGKMGGMPVIENTRIPVSLIVACLKDEMTFVDICEEYRITNEDIENAMKYVIKILDIPYQEG